MYNSVNFGYISAKPNYHTTCNLYNTVGCTCTTQQLYSSLLVTSLKLHTFLIVISVSTTNDSPLAVSEVRTSVEKVTETLLRSAPSSTATYTVATASTPSITVYVVWLNPILTTVGVRKNSLGYNIEIEQLF